MNRKGDPGVNKMTDVSTLPGPNADLWDWQLRALCRDLSSAVFFHPWGERGERRQEREVLAKQVCRSCPVVSQCAAHALAAREQYGVWGGVGEDERRMMLRGSGRRDRRSRPRDSASGPAPDRG